VVHTGSHPHRDTQHKIAFRTAFRTPCCRGNCDGFLTFLQRVQRFTSNKTELHTSGSTGGGKGRSRGKKSNEGKDLLHHGDYLVLIRETMGCCDVGTLQLAISRSSGSRCASQRSRKTEGQCTDESRQMDRHTQRNSFIQAFWIFA
jgi:hypothetical protein